MRIPLFGAVVTDLIADEASVRRRRWGCIESSAGRFVSLRLTPMPKLLSVREVWPMGDRYHARGPADRCRLYYYHPRSAGDYLALRYLVTTSGAAYRTVLAALRTLDRVAAIKQSRAIVCDAANLRLSERVLRRHGYRPHAPMRWRRNYIRRLRLPAEEPNERTAEFRRRLLAAAGSHA